MGLYDVIIIGGGITGASVLRELSRYKLRIALLEKEEELAFGVSKSNSGIIHPGTQNSPDSLKGRLCVEGNLLTRKICKELNVGFSEIGELIVAFTEDEVRELDSLKEDAEALGVPGIRSVDRSWLMENEPNLNREVIAALYAPSAGIVSPYRMVYALAENALRNGAEVNTLTMVESITSSADTGRRPVFEICTNSGVFRTRYIVNAAGLYADEVSRMVGVDDFEIKPRKGEEFLLDSKREGITNHLIFPLPSENTKGILIIKTSDGNPMIGPTADDVDMKEELSTSDEGLDRVLRGAQKMVPSINKKDIIAYFSGLRPSAGTDFIIRNEEKVPGFINAAGIQSPGLTAAPAIALMIVNMLKTSGLSMRRKLFFRGHREPVAHLFSSTLLDIESLIRKTPEYGDIICRCEMVSAGEVRDSISHGARTLDGIKFRTRAQAGRCHGGFCTTRLMKILSSEAGIPLTEITKRGRGSEIIKGLRGNDK